MARKLGHLLDNWKNAKDLLRREPEALGEVLLDHLLENWDDSQRIELDEVISQRVLFGVFDEGERYNADQVTDMRCRYPAGKDKDVRYALMEGWQWLIAEVLVAPEPEVRPLGTQLYFVTRRGIKLGKNLADLQE